MTNTILNLGEKSSFALEGKILRSESCSSIQTLNAIDHKKVFAKRPSASQMKYVYRTYDGFAYAQA